MTLTRGWKGGALYATILVVMVAGARWILTLAFAGRESADAIRLSGLVVVVVQLTGFAAIRALGPGRMMIGWGIVALLRLLTLVVFAGLVGKVLQMPLAPALISMAVFFFLSTLIEPLFLRT